MTNALDDLITALSLFYTVLDNEGVDLDTLDYQEFLEGTIPSLAEKIESELLDIVYLRYLELDRDEFQDWLEEMGASA